MSHPILLPTALPFPEAFPAGAVLLVDKPLGWSSFDVVNKIRFHLKRRLKMKNLKVGHAGTLDPLATGLLVICIGNYTKRIDEFQAMPKAYTGTITFGATTPSFDLEKGVDATYPTEHLTEVLLQEAAQQFVGNILQIPPVFSAVKVDGKRLYKNARTGEEVELPHRPVYVESFTVGPLRAVSPERAAPIVADDRGGAKIMLHPDHAAGLQSDFEVVCGKGTYIRSLAHDLGQAVGSGAYLSALRRTRTGGFSIEDAWEIKALVSWVG